MNVVNILKAQSIELNLYSQILDKLYKCYNHSDTRYNMLKTNEQLQLVKSNDCYVTAQFQGVAYILFFCSIEIAGSKKKMNILIPKKDLKDTKEKNKNNEIKMYNLYVPFVNEEYYNNGTIMDGKITKSNDSVHKIEHTFIVHELYYEPLKDTDLLEKYQIIKKDFLPKFEKINGCKFVVARLYEQLKLNELLDKLSLAKHKVVGLMFLFRKTKQYLVYTNENEFDILRQGKPLQNNKSYANSTQEFKMCKTKITDVYNLYDLEDDTYVEIAGIPDIATSHYYRELFLTEDSIKVHCIRSEKFKKWIPIVNDCYDHIIHSLINN